MRLVGAFLFVALAGSFASADDAKPSDSQPAPAPTAAKPKVPLRVVRILPETHQALLFDKTKGTHVLADIGKTIDGFLVDDIDDDEVTLTAEGGAQIVLAAPDRSWRRHDDRDDREARPAKPAVKPADKKTAPAPQDPYAAAAPVDPYGEPEVRTVEAPHAIDAGEGEVRTAEAPGTTVTTVTATPAPTATLATATLAPTATPATATPAPKPAPTTPATAKQISDANALAAVATGTAPTDALVLSRADVNAALGNFSQLTASVKGSFTPAGVKLDAVNADSLFAKAGLKAGDVITSINNQPLKSLDDAANLYARAASTKALLVAVTRANKPITLRVVIQ